MWCFVLSLPRFSPSFFRSSLLHVVLFLKISTADNEKSKTDTQKWQAMKNGTEMPLALLLLAA